MTKSNPDRLRKAWRTKPLERAPVSAGEGQMNDQSHPRSYPKIFSWILLPLILLALAGIGLASERRVQHLPKSARVVAQMPQDEFEQRVRTYLLEHPEVIKEAIDRLEARQAEQDAAQVRTH